jgi:hypothetical protein
LRSGSIDSKYDRAAVMLSGEKSHARTSASQNTGSDQTHAVPL